MLSSSGSRSLESAQKTKPPPSFLGGGFDTKPNQAGRLGDFDLANAVNGCVHNEGDAVFIPFLIFRIRSKKTKPPPSFPGGGCNNTPNQGRRLGNLNLANAVNGCVHNESDAVFIPFLMFRIRSKKQNHLPVSREAASTLNQTKLGV
jgi:hypothetical protein